MFLFLKLILAHLIADFILQFEELYQLKVRSLLGHFFHALIHALVSFALAAPYVRAYPWLSLYLIALAVIHHFQDVIKYRLQAKHPKQIFWCFTLDQALHFLFIATCLLLPLSSKVLGFPDTPVLSQFYRDSQITLFLIAMIASTFKAAYFLHALRLSFIPGSRPDHFISSPEIWHALLERSWMTGWILFAPILPAIPAALSIGLTRLFSPKLKNGTDFLLSFAYAAIVALVFRGWLEYYS